VGLLDIVAAGALAVALLMPSPSRPIRPLYGKEAVSLAPRIAEAQARVALDPEDGTAAAALADLLVLARQTDWAIRAAVRAAPSESPDAWRAMVAASAAHVDRYEIRQGLEWAEKALAACEKDGAACADHERARLSLYAGALRAAFDSRIDPRRNPDGFTDAVQRAVPLIRLGHP
jgi:hypothetical protein